MNDLMQQHHAYDRAPRQARCPVDYACSIERSAPPTFRSRWFVIMVLIGLAVLMFINAKP